MTSVLAIVIADFLRIKQPLRVLPEIVGSIHAPIKRVHRPVVHKVVMDSVGCSVVVATVSSVGSVVAITRRISGKRVLTGCRWIWVPPQIVGSRANSLRNSKSSFQIAFAVRHGKAGYHPGPLNDVNHVGARVRQVILRFGAGERSRPCRPREQSGEYKAKQDP